MKLLVRIKLVEVPEKCATAASAVALLLVVLRRSDAGNRDGGASRTVTHPLALSDRVLVVP